MEHVEHLDPFMQVIVPYVNFALFATAAFFLFRKPLLNSIASKRQDFEKLLAESGQLKRDAQQKHDQIKSKLHSIDDELKRLELDMKAQAQAEAATAQASGEKLATHLKEEAKRIAASELEQAKVHLRQELLDAAYQLAQKELKTRLTAGEQERLFGKSIEDLNKIQMQ